MSEELHRLKARYLRYVDTKRFDEWGALFTEDAVLTPRPRECWRGREEIVARIREGLDGVTTVHHCHMPEITVHGDGTASGIWAMEDLLVFPPGHPSGLARLHGYGHYHECYRRDGDGAWRIAAVELRRLHRDITRAAPSPT